MTDRPISLSAADLAARASVSVETIEQLAQLGILRPRSDADAPYAPADAMRVELALATERDGIPRSELGAAISAGQLSLAYLDALPPPAPVLTETVAAFAARLGLDVGVVRQTIAAFGLPVPDPEERVRQDDAVILEMLPVYVRAGLDGNALYAACRIYGDAIRHLARYQVDLFHTTMEEPYRQQGLTDGALLDHAVSDVAAVTSEMGPRLVAWLYERHSETFAIQHRLDHAQAALEDAGLRSRRTDETPAIVFLDLTGYTALTEREGDEASADVALQLAAVVDAPVRDHGGQVVKWLGDGVELYFVEPLDAVLCSLELIDAVAAGGLPPAHIGINAGGVVYRGGDYYGRTVNIASRIAAVAQADQILVAEDVARHCQGSGVTFSNAGSFVLKGVVDPVPLLLVERPLVRGDA